MVCPADLLPGGVPLLTTGVNFVQRVRFGAFEFEGSSGELWRDGVPVRIQPQPAKVLGVLIRRTGQVVSRQELVDEVWGAGTFVDFEQGLNYAIRQIRTVLEDEAEHPRFLETLPRRGYRFIAPIETAPPEEAGKAAEAEAGLPVIATEESDPASRRGIRLRGFAVAGVALVAAAAVAVVAGYRMRHRETRETSSHPIRSLAVLPLRNLSHDPEQEYFSEGMTDQLITDLARFGGLRVISHTSVNRYKDTNRSLPEIALELGVDAIVEGEVLRANDRVRISAQLIDARSDVHLWANSYEGEMRDVLSLQDDVAQQIATEVGIKAADGNEKVRMRPVRTVNPAALEAYMRGNFYWSRSNCDGSRRSLPLYEQAAALDPGFAQAYAGIAQANLTLGDWGCSPHKEAFAKSKAAALKAIELDNTLGPPHTWLGTLAFFYEWDWDNADKEYRKAIELDPNYAPAHLYFAVFLASMGKQDQAVAEMRRAQELDPTAELTNMGSVHVLYLLRRYDQAIEQGRNTLQLYPDSWGTYFWMGIALERKGMDGEAFESYLKAESLRGSKPDQLEEFREAYRAEGLRGYWKQVRETLSAEELQACSLRAAYAQAGDKERMLAFLNRAMEDRCGNMRTLKVDSAYDWLRGDPEFKELLARLRLS